MVGEKVLLNVSLMKDHEVRKEGKLSPRFVGPFEVLERVGEVPYRIALPPNLSGVHPAFHVSRLRRYHADMSHMLDYSAVQLDESLGYEEEPVAIVDRQVRKLRSKKISAAKVLVCIGKEYVKRSAAAILILDVQLFRIDIPEELNMDCSFCG
ncbi:uncharacterized protein [Nicotiana tomentosiformis]|uniref:uncharacterized protein n=1 Tax=Nicotiana tomentosiformis TaxID=4098 RepID=UPI00388CD31B